MDKIKEYFLTTRVSNSLLGAVNNPRLMYLKRENPEKYDEEVLAFKLGAAVDCLLTSPYR